MINITPLAVSVAVAVVSGTFRRARSSRDAAHIRAGDVNADAFSLVSRPDLTSIRPLADCH
ncbi:hypothetical protein [Nocardia fluminea]|uniref:hypothetical protein n=1 Tax=Nocardia fluminea TaxID=134984 RepID=UPI0033D9BB47